MKRQQVFVRGRLPDGSIGNIDVLDLDDASFRAFVIDVLWRAGAVVGIKDEHVKGQRIQYAPPAPPRQCVVPIPNDPTTPTRMMNEARRSSPCPRSMP